MIYTSTLYLITLCDMYIFLIFKIYLELSLQKKTTLDSIPRGGTGPVTNSVANPDMG